jgi:hypothetical protein
MESAALTRCLRYDSQEAWGEFQTVCSTPKPRTVNDSIVSITPDCQVFGSDFNENDAGVDQSVNITALVSENCFPNP